MSSEVTTASRWDALHEQERHRLFYPSEHVVRFIAGLPMREGKALDIGCGGGRHVKLLDEAGFTTCGVDVTVSKLIRGSFEYGDMRALPFFDGHFDVALAYGVFYYATPDEADQAVKEMHRVLRRGGRGFVCVRSTRDWRADHVGQDGVFRLDGDPEDGMQLDFISEDDLNDVYGIFSEVRYEISEWTTHDRDRLNSDWLISVTK